QGHFQGFLGPQNGVGIVRIRRASRRIATKERISAALTGYETASVIQRITAKARTAKDLCPASDNPSGAGSKRPVAKTAKAAISQLPRFSPRSVFGLMTNPLEY